MRLTVYTIQMSFPRYRSHYLDRASLFLPPCAYNPPGWYRHYEGGGSVHPGEDAVAALGTDNDEEGVPSASDRRLRPAQHSPLSVLCVQTSRNGLHLYLHGRYRTLSIPPCAGDAPGVSARIVCTSDLSAIAVSAMGEIGSSGVETCGGQSLRIYYIPDLSKRRYELQIVAASYCSVAAHLHSIRGGIEAASASWTNALRPLDAKFEKLAKILRDYGVLGVTSAGDISETASAVRAELLALVLGGRPMGGGASSAMDQFFSGAVMNDQLLQRMNRTIEAGAASAEGTLRKCVLGPARAALYDALEFRAHIRTMNVGEANIWGAEEEDDCDADKSEGSPPFIDIAVADRFCDAAEALLTSIERCLLDLVCARFRLRDILGWIRATASRIKARGTAADSIMREHARKRRLSDAAIRRVAEILAPKDGEKEGKNLILVDVNLAECILGVALSVSVEEIMGNEAMAEYCLF